MILPALAELPETTETDASLGFLPPEIIEEAEVGNILHDPPFVEVALGNA